MKSSDTKRLVAGLAMALGLGLATVNTIAQTAPAKPAAKPAATSPSTQAATKAAAKPSPGASSTDAGTSTLGNASVSSKLLTRDELRACFKQRDVLASRLTELETARVAMDKERNVLTQEQQALKTERDSLGGVKPAIEELNAKTKAFQVEVDDWTRRVAAFNEAKDFGAAAEKKRVEINEQGETLQKRQAELQVERAALMSRGDEVVKGFNARAGTIDVRVAEWNERNRQLNNSLEDIRGERDTWGRECGDRRYRDDDEKAILSGK